MRKVFSWIINIILMALIFGAGFYVGILDNIYNNRIVITSQCAGSGVKKTMSANFERVDGQIIRDEKFETEIHTTRCLCYASDKTHKNLWVDTVEISADSADAAGAQCASGCQAMCEERLKEFTF